MIDEFYARVCAALDGLPFELVLVDDGSTDGSPLGARAPRRQRPARARRLPVAQLRPPDRADRRAWTTPAATRW